MTKHRYTVTGPFRIELSGEAADPGGEILLDPDDDVVQWNLLVGFVKPISGAKPEPAMMTCPLCSDDLEMKRPPKLASASDLAEHYQTKHPGFSTPEWRTD